MSQRIEVSGFLLRCELMREVVQFGGSLLVGNARTQAGGDFQAKIVGYQWIGFAIGQGRELAERYPQRLRQAAVDSDEILRRNADHGEGMAVDADGPAHDAGIAVKPRAP